MKSYTLITRYIHLRFGFKALANGKLFRTFSVDEFKYETDRLSSVYCFSAIYKQKLVKLFRKYPDAFYVGSFVSDNYNQKIILKKCEPFQNS